MPPLGWVLFTLPVPMARKEPCAIPQKTTIFLLSENMRFPGGTTESPQVLPGGGGARPGCSQNCPALPSTAQSPGGRAQGAPPPTPKVCRKSPGANIFSRGCSGILRKLPEIPKSGFQDFENPILGVPGNWKTRFRDFWEIFRGCWTPKGCSVLAGLFLMTP